MIQISPHTKIFISLDPVDFRCGIDRLGAICQQLFEVDPRQGAIYVFCNRSRRSIKLLFHDSTGFWLCHKRLSQGRFEGWPQTFKEALAITARELMVLLWDGKHHGVFRPLWKPLSLVKVEDARKENSTRTNSETD